MEENKLLAIYHRVMSHEPFEAVAPDLFQLVVETQKRSPNQKRALYLDIDGHRLSGGAFDDDMFELMKDFLMGFLLQFLSKISCPLYEISNPAQIDEIPEELKIISNTYRRKSKLSDYHIENYSNTEFTNELQVSRYLRNISILMNKLSYYNLHEITYCEDDTFNNYFITWVQHIRELVIEIFNSYIYGNLFSSISLTRTLIECYVYLKILIENESGDLITDWYFCNIVKKINDEKSSVDVEPLKASMKKIMELRGLDYESTYKLYKKGSENAWLNATIGKNRVTFRDACDFANASYIYDDFKIASSFIHGQDIQNKFSPFTFYQSIASKFHISFFYIFRSLELIIEDEKILNEISDYEIELNEIVRAFTNESSIE